MPKDMYTYLDTGLVLDQICKEKNPIYLSQMQDQVRRSEEIKAYSHTLPNTLHFKQGPKNISNITQMEINRTVWNCSINKN